MEFIERLGLLAMATVGSFCWVFMIWRWLPLPRKSRGGAMSRGRIVWTLLGGLSIILCASLVALGLWLYGPPPRVTNSKVEAFTVGAMFLAWFGWGVTEIAIALRAAFARKRA